MKMICKLSIIFLAFALMACQKEPIGETTPTVGGVTIVDGMIQSPEWLVSRLDSIANLRPSYPSGEKIYPWVYGVEHNGQDYICLIDIFNSCWTCGHLYFSLSGNHVDPGSPDMISDLYNDLEDARRENGILLWPKH